MNRESVAAGPLETWLLLRNRFEYIESARLPRREQRREEPGDHGCHHEPPELADGNHQRVGELSAQHPRGLGRQLLRTVGYTPKIA